MPQSWCLALLVFALLGCEKGSFSASANVDKSVGKAKSKESGGSDVAGVDASDGDDGNESGWDTDHPAVKVPVGDTASVPGLPPSDKIKSCTSDDESIAKVEAKTCKITGVSEGATKVKVTLEDGTSKPVKVTVIGSDDGGKGADSGDDAGDESGGGKTKLTIPVGDTKKVTDDTGASCVSKDPDVAKVDKDTCEVTGVSPGKTSIEITTDKGKTSKVTITVPNPNDLGTEDGELSKKKGGTCEKKVPASGSMSLTLGDGAPGNATYDSARSWLKVRCKDGEVEEVLDWHGEGTGVAGKHSAYVLHAVLDKASLGINLTGGAPCNGVRTILADALSQTPEASGTKASTKAHFTPRHGCHGPGSGESTLESDPVDCSCE